MIWLKQYQRSIHSQYGEDGLIAYLLAMLRQKTGICVDIGAFDGQHLSNIYALVESGFHAVMAECHPDRVNELRRTAAAHAPLITVLKDKITTDTVWHVVTAVKLAQDSTDEHLPPAVLSLDIDGGEAAIWQELTESMRFPIVCIEWNAAGNRHPWGVCKTAWELGYHYVYSTNANAIFLDSQAYAQLCETLEVDDV